MFMPLGVSSESRWQGLLYNRGPKAARRSSAVEIACKGLATRAGFVAGRGE